MKRRQIKRTEGTDKAMELEWQISGEYKGNPKYTATYEAWQTPMGPAMATATIAPDVYFPRSANAETWIEDPFLEALGVRSYESIKTGEQIAATYEESAEKAREICEGYVYREVTAGPFHLRSSYGRLYDDKALAAAASWYVSEQCGHEPNGILSVDLGKHMVDMQVLEGGYEPARWQIYIGDDFTFDVYCK